MLFTGIPLLLFLLFSISTFVVSLLVAVMTAFMASLTFTLFAVGGALLIVLPTVLFTTFAACSVFLWGLVVFVIYSWASGGASSKQVLGMQTNGKKA